MDGQMPVQQKADRGGGDGGKPEAENAAGRVVDDADALVHGAAEERVFQPSGNAGGECKAGNAPPGIDAEQVRQGLREEVTETEGEDDANDREVEWRSCVAQRIEGRRVET